MTEPASGFVRIQIKTHGDVKVERANIGDENAPVRPRFETLLLEEEHLPGWVLILCAVLLAFPLLGPVTKGEAGNLSYWIVCLIITFVVLELPYVLVLWGSKYRRGLFGAAGIEKQLVYRIWRMKTQRYAWEDILLVACTRIANNEGADGLVIELRLTSGKKVDLVHLAWSENRIEELRLACKELILSES